MLYGHFDRSKQSRPRTEKTHVTCANAFHRGHLSLSTYVVDLFGGRLRLLKSIGGIDGKTFI